MNVLERIEYQLKKYGMSRRQLAKEIDIPATTLNSVFARNAKNLSIEMASKIAKYFDVPVNYLSCLSPFEDIEFLHKNKVYIMETLSQYEAFKIVSASYNLDNENLADNFYYWILDIFVDEIFVSSKSMVMKYKLFDVDTRKTLTFGNSHEIMRDTDNRLENMTDEEIAIVLSYRSLDINGKQYVKQSIELAEKAYMQLSISLSDNNLEVERAKTTKEGDANAEKD